MKILYLSGALGSLGNHDVRLLRSFVERGHHPILVSYHPEEPSEDVKRLKGLTVFHKKPRWFKRFQRIFYWNRVKDLRKVILEQNPDIMISINTWNNTYLGALSGFHPHISIPMGSDIMVYPHKYFWTCYQNRRALHGADIVAPDCLFVKRMIMNDYGIPEEKLVLFYWGIDTSVFKPRDGKSRLRKQRGWEDKKVVIMNRHFEKVYGIEYFLNALPVVLKKLPDLRVFLIGDGSLKGNLQKKISGHKLEPIVYLPGRVSRSEMVEYLQNADLYISSSLSDGTSVSLLEAMACKLPVLCTDVPANLEWITNGENGLVVPKANSTALAKEVVRLFNDIQLKEIMGRRNLELATTKGDWQKNVSMLEEQCRKLVCMVRR